MILPIFIPTSLSDTLLLLKLLCLLLFTFTYILTSSFTFFTAAIKAFKWAVAALNIIVDASTINYAAVVSVLANIA